MEKYDIILKKIEELRKNASNILIKISTGKYSENINELSKLSYEIKKSSTNNF